MCHPPDLWIGLHGVRGVMRPLQPHENPMKTSTHAHTHTLVMDTHSHVTDRLLRHTLWLRSVSLHTQLLTTAHLTCIALCGSSL